MPRTSEESDTFRRLCREFPGPILLNYVWWVLTETHKKGIRTLYFLARDGYLLYQIALLFCEVFHLNIECHYLYCSRKALRMPSYHFIGDEAYDQLLFRGYQSTLNAFFDRADLTQDEREQVCIDCGLMEFAPDEPLNIAVTEQLRQRLRESRVFQKIIVEKSKAAYACTIGYFKQEGLLEQEMIAVVDSGWSGSMQRSLRQLLESAGYKGKICGFYFGMYLEPQDEHDGEYITWYFNAKGRITDKVLFSNNLFECLLSAPHGMTVGYTEQNGRYEPIMLKPPVSDDLLTVQRQIEYVLAYCRKTLPEKDFTRFNIRSATRETRRLMHRYMGRPTCEEAKAYGAFGFCDDITEAYKIPLADPKQVPSLKSHLFSSRLKRRLNKKNKNTSVMPVLYWPYGTIAFLPKWKQPWYRLNIFLWECLRYIRYRKG